MSNINRLTLNLDDKRVAAKQSSVIPPIITNNAGEIRYPCNLLTINNIVKAKARSVIEKKIISNGCFFRDDIERTPNLK